MKNFRFLFFLCLIITIIFPSTSWARKRQRPYNVTARSALLYDVSKKKILYGKDVDRLVPPASTTKIMTALLVMEKLPLDKIITVNKTAANVAPTKINVVPGEHYKVSDLLFAALMQSANDVSVVLAEAVAGSEEEFVKMMNQRAKELGAKNTRFVNCNGLPTDTVQYTTANDMATLYQAALKYPFFREVESFKYKTIYSQEGRKIPLRSYNKLLWQNWKKKIYGKTGYTRKAQHCFVGYFKDGKNTFVINVFGASRRWSDIKYIINKYGGFRL